MIQLPKISNTKSDYFPEKILQFGEGNFLRGFADWMIQEMNNKVEFGGSVVLVQPIENGLTEIINRQGGNYTIYMRGLKNGIPETQTDFISCVSRAINPYTAFNEFMETAENADIRFIISNTTESGIAYNESDRFDTEPPVSFPGKLTVWLYRRFSVFHGSDEKGVIAMPCELIEQNGTSLKNIVLKLAKKWYANPQFEQWITNSNVFCNTLVDRIVTGFPKDSIAEINQVLGYEDSLVVESELFHLWVIEGPAWIENELPFRNAGLNVIFTNDLSMYRTRKVRILNGAHTSLLPIAYLSGFNTVKETLDDSIMEKLLNDILFQEIIPTLNMPVSDLEYYANEVINRFKNPYIKHFWTSIALNSISKFTTRVLPSFLSYVSQKKEIPVKLGFSLAALLYFYKGNRNSESIPLNDSAEILQFFSSKWSKFDENSELLPNIIHDMLSKTDFWNTDLSQINGLHETVVKHIQNIHNKGIEFAIHQIY